MRLLRPLVCLQFAIVAGDVAPNASITKLQEENDKLRREINALKAREADNVPAVLGSGSDHMEEGHEIYIHLIGKHSFSLQMAIMLCLVSGSLIHDAGISWLPESAVFVFIGIAMGCLIIWFTNQEFNSADIDYWFAHVNDAALNLILLPPIIFESGWSLRIKDFLSQVMTILIFAVFGTIISTTVVATGIYFTESFHGVNEFRTAFTYAALISAVDPVATLAAYSHLKVEPLLNIVVFGESIINDAVSIALFKAGNADPDVPLEPGDLALTMTWLLLGSSVLGILVGALLSGTMRWVKMPHHADFTAAAVVMAAWFTFILAEGIVHCSGIIASLSAGTAMGILLKPHLEENVETKVSFALKQIATMCDITIFLLVGMAGVLLDKIDFGFCALMAALCLLGRLCAVFPLGWFVNCIKRSHGRRNRLPESSWNILSNGHLFMMWCAGLRGGIAMALVLQMNAVKEDPNAKKFRQSTFVVIVAYLFTFGSTTQYFLKKAGISFGTDAPEDALAPSDEMDLGKSFSRSVLRKSFSLVDTAKNSTCSLASLDDTAPHSGGRRSRGSLMSGNSDQVKARLSEPLSEVSEQRQIQSFEQSFEQESGAVAVNPDPPGRSKSVRFTSRQESQ